MAFEIRIEHMVIAVLMFIVLRNLLDEYLAQQEKAEKIGKKKGPARMWRPRNPKP